MNTEDRSIAVQIKQAPIKQNLRYIWIEPYLIVPIGSDKHYINDTILRLEERIGVSVNMEV